MVFAVACNSRGSCTYLSPLFINIGHGLTCVAPLAFSVIVPNKEQNIQFDDNLHSFGVFAERMENECQFPSFFANIVLFFVHQAIFARLFYPLLDQRAVHKRTELNGHNALVFVPSQLVRSHFYYLTKTI